MLEFLFSSYKIFNSNNHSSEIYEKIEIGNSDGFLLCIFKSFDSNVFVNFAFNFFSLSLSERYRVDEVSQDSREDCYLATLHIIDADVLDSRPYYLVVENERGIDRHAINLVVEGMFTGAFHIFLPLL